MEERWFVYGFSDALGKIVLTAPDFGTAQMLAFEQAQGILVPMNHCMIEWNKEVIEELKSIETLH